MDFLETLLNGLSSGSTYAMIALGYTMVYGIAKMLNFAHGDVIMVGAYLIYVFIATTNPLLAILFSVIGCVILGITIEKIAYRPLRNASSSLAVLITATIKILQQQEQERIKTAEEPVHSEVFLLYQKYLL